MRSLRALIFRESNPEALVNINLAISVVQSSTETKAVEAKRPHIPDVANKLKQGSEFPDELSLTKSPAEVHPDSDAV